MATNYVTCTRCGSQNSSLSTTCLKCGAMLPIGPMPMQPVSKPQVPGADKKLAAGLCGILLGGFGVHKFILGYNNEGIILVSIYIVGLILTIVSCGILFFIPLIPSIVGLVEGIIYLTKSDEEFVQTYVVNKKPWF